MSLSAKSTAIEALQGANLIGQTAVVTGGNSGIGVETVRALAHAGSSVILTSRKLEAGNKVAEEVRASGVKGSIHVEQLDLADLASVHAFTKRLRDKNTRIDKLILNAGVMACPLMYTKDGFEMQIGTNNHGHFALVQDLLPHLKSQSYPVRIVAVSSLAAFTPKRFLGGGIDLDDLHWKNRGYSRWGAYGQSKLANVLFAKALAQRCEGTNIKTYSLHPGSIKTNLQQHVGWIKWLQSIPLLPAKTIPQGAATSIYAACSPELESRSGEYLSDCKPCKPPAEWHDQELVEALWKRTEAEVNAGKPLDG
jgi:NAD(P)-dependent dehydrogenase (short-subunit alcohol dehydrogenase family)